MKTLSTLFVVLVFILDSCSTIELLTSDVKPTEVIDLQYFEPFSNVYLFDKRKNMIQNDSLSIVSKQLLNESVQEFKNNISLTGTIIVTNNTIKQRLEKDIEYLYMNANDIKVLSISSIRITPLIDSLLEANNKRFGLIIVECGYIRTNRNYGNQIAVSVPINILSRVIVPGSPLSIPHKAYSALYVMIVDAEQDNIAFYRKTSKFGAPTDKSVITYQLNKIFKGYYF
ncbi:MAG TPA: hypothetical protein VIK14_17240 [Ignavibacteria bacterium]